MHGPPHSPTEIREILRRSVRRYRDLGLHERVAIAATARDFGTSEDKVAALVSTVSRARDIAA